jgi:hypothetical protein
MIKKIKIKLECWWTDSNSLSYRFKKQFIPTKDLDKYELVSDNPDYTIIFGKTNFEQLTTPKEKTFYFSQEPLWSPNQPKKNLNEFCNKIFISDKNFYDDSPEYIETLLPMFYGGRGDIDGREEWDWSQNLFERNFSTQKNDFISSIVTNSYNSHLDYLSDTNKHRIIYKERVDIINQICNRFPKVKLWGSFQPQNKINLMGVAWNKLVSLNNFKFSICFENTIQKNYITEKFWDCILTDTVPIYFGCSNINDYIDENSFVNLTTHIDNIDYIYENISYIIDNIDLLYEKYLPYIKKLKKQFVTNKQFNLWERIKSEIDENYEDINGYEILDR